MKEVIDIIISIVRVLSMFTTPLIALIIMDTREMKKAGGFTLESIMYIYNKYNPYLVPNFLFWYAIYLFLIF
jgi:hypothetical protein